MLSYDNRTIGNQFEKIFKKQAQSLGLLAIKNELNAKYIGGGGVRAFKGDLDYKLIDRAGNVGFFDCKTFEKDQFTYSQIEPHQLDRSIVYQEWGVPTGFIVWFRESNSVVYFSPKRITFGGPRSCFFPEDGLILGTYESFRLKSLLLIRGTNEDSPLKPY